MQQSRKVPFNISHIDTYNAWLLGFVFADAMIGMQQNKRVVKLYNKDEALLSRVKSYYHLPYKVVKQSNISNTVYFIRISDPDFVKAIENYGFKEDKSSLSIPKMNKECMRLFLAGFLKGKGSYFTEKDERVKGYKVNYRSKSLMYEISVQICKLCKVKVKIPYCRKIKNVQTCGVKYVGREAEMISKFLSTETPLFFQNGLD